MATALRDSEDFELIRVVLVQKRNWYTHHTKVITWNRVNERHFDGVIVIVLLIADVTNFLVTTGLYVVGHRHKLQWLRATAIVNVGEPANVIESLILTIGNSEIHPCVERQGTHTHLVVLEQKEDFRVCYRIHVSDNGEPALTLDQPRDELSEQREGRVGDDDVSLRYVALSHRRHGNHHHLRGTPSAVHQC